MIECGLECREPLVGLLFLIDASLSHGHSDAWPTARRQGPGGETVRLICFALTVLNEKLFRVVFFLPSLLSLGNFIFLRVLLMESTEPNSLKFNLAA